MNFQIFQHSDSLVHSELESVRRTTSSGEPAIGMRRLV